MTTNDTIYLTFSRALARRNELLREARRLLDNLQPDRPTFEQLLIERWRDQVKKELGE